MNFFSKLNLLKLNEVISRTERQLFLGLPAIPEITSKAIVELKSKLPEVDIKILIDFDPQTFRQGYGEYEAFEALDINKIELINFPDNRISFIISDNIGYYLFFESQYLVPAEKETLNAIKIDSVSLVKLKQFFFNQSNIVDFTDELSNAIIEESEILVQLDKTKELPEPATTKIISKEEKEEVKKDLEKKPPLKPEHKRLIDIYSNKFQYVDLSFRGVKIKNVDVPVPKDLLPIKNESLREQFKTKIKVFENPDKIEELNELKKLENELKEIRKDYLFHSQICNKSIIDFDVKKEFESRIKIITEKIPNLTTKLLESLDTEKNRTRERFFNEVKELVRKEPTIVLREDSPWIKDPKSVEIAATKKADEVKTKIKWPDLFELIENLTITKFYSDITLEELFNKDFQNELLANKIITKADVNQLSNFRKVVEVSEKKTKTNHPTLFDD